MVPTPSPIHRKLLHPKLSAPAFHEPTLYFWLRYHLLTQCIWSQRPRCSSCYSSKTEITQYDFLSNTDADFDFAWPSSDRWNLSISLRVFASRYWYYRLCEHDRFMHLQLTFVKWDNSSMSILPSSILPKSFALTLQKEDEIPIIHTTIPSNTTLHIRATPLEYSFGYNLNGQSIAWIATVASSWLAFAPANFFVFEGASFGLFASGNGNPWPWDASDVGFEEVREVYFVEDIPDYDVWS